MARGETLVLDHLAGLDPDDRPGTARFDRLADALASGLVWVKLTWFRRSRRPGDYGDMEAVVGALADCAPERILWGSDWPFVRTEQPPDPARLLGQLQVVAGRRRVPALPAGQSLLPCFARPMRLTARQPRI